MQKWVEAVQARDIDRVLALYDEQQSVFWGTFADHIRVSRAQAKTYFDRFLSAASLQCEVVEAVAHELAPTVVNLIGSYRFTIAREEGADPVASMARFTYTFKLDADSGQWLIVEHHSSLMPENGY